MHIRSLSSFFALATLAFAAEARAQTTAWENILNLTLPYGQTYSMLTPTAVLRPHKGDLFRISVPLACGAVQIYQLGAYGRTTSGQTIALAANLISTEQNLLGGVNQWTYQVNGGSPATVYSIGLWALTAAWPGCTIAFEQANTQASLPGCELNYVCTAHVDNTFACAAWGTNGTEPAFTEFATPGADNECNVRLGLSRKICDASQSPDDFTIECVTH